MQFAARGTIVAGSSASSCPPAPVQVSQQRSGTRPPHGKETDLAGEGLRFVPDDVPDIARNRSGEHDSEGPGEVGSQTRCRSGRRLHQRVIRHRRLTLHGFTHFYRCLSVDPNKLRNETRADNTRAIQPCPPTGSASGGAVRSERSHSADHARRISPEPATRSIEVSIGNALQRVVRLEENGDLL